MFETIDNNNFETKVLKEKRLVMLAYIRRDHKYSEMAGFFKKLSADQDERLKILLLDEDQRGIRERLKITGDPTIIGFSMGEEQGRLLGCVDKVRLYLFVELLMLHHGPTGMIH